MFEVEKTTMKPEAGYARLARLIDALKPVLAVDGWYHLPADAAESRQSWPAFADKVAFLAHVKRHYDKDVKEWPEYPGGFSALLCNAYDEASFKQAAGRSTLTFSPGYGRLQLEVVKPDVAMPDVDLTTWAKKILRAVVIEEWVTFANTDVVQRPRADGEKGADYLSVDYRTFPHRQFLGWMGWVQRLPPAKPINAEDLPQAAEVIPIPGRSGSLIVAVGETFDVHNPHHIMQAQKVEMRLVDLDALPVIDPAFM